MMENAILKYIQWITRCESIEYIFFCAVMYLTFVMGYINVKVWIWAVTHKITLDYRSQTAALTCLGQFYQNLWFCWDQVMSYIFKKILKNQNKKMSHYFWIQSKQKEYGLVQFPRKKYVVFDSDSLKISVFFDKNF